MSPVDDSLKHTGVDSAIADYTPRPTECMWHHCLIYTSSEGLGASVIFLVFWTSPKIVWPHICAVACKFQLTTRVTSEVGLCHPDPCTAGLLSTASIALVSQECWMCDNATAIVITLPKTCICGGVCAWKLTVYSALCKQLRHTWTYGKCKIKLRADFSEMGILCVFWYFSVHHYYCSFYRGDQAYKHCR